MSAFGGASGFDASPKSSKLSLEAGARRPATQDLGLGSNNQAAAEVRRLAVQDLGPGSNNPVVDEARRWRGQTTVQIHDQAVSARDGGGDPFLNAYSIDSSIYDRSCAGFVSSVLVAEGLLPETREHGSSNDYLSTNKLVPALVEQGFSEQTGVTSGNLMDPAWCQANLKPGDVVVVNNANFGHAMIYTGVDPQTNRPMFIGANGVDEDQSGAMVGPFSPQKVTEVGWSTVQQWMGDGSPQNGDGLTISVYSPPQ